MNSDQVDNLAAKVLNSDVFPYAFPALGWIFAWNAQLAITDYFFLPDYLSVIYFTSGVQICSAMLFGLRGIVGSQIGSIVAFWFFPHARYPAEIWELSLLTLFLSAIAYGSVEIVRKFNRLDDNFENVTKRNLFSIILIYNAACTAAHYIWTTYVNHSFLLPHEYVGLGFASRVVGSFIVMYLFLAVFEFLTRIKTKS